MRIPPVKLFAAAATCVLAAGCTGTGSAPSQGDQTQASGSQTLKWLIEEPEDAEALQALEDHVATFEKESGHTVNVQTLPFENMRTILQTQLRSGEGPDVFNWGSGPDFGGALAKAGLVHDLTDAYEQHGWKVFDFAKERVTVDGKVYGIPGEMETIGIFYNKKIFAELGLEEPKSIDDLQQAAEQIKSSGTLPISLGDKEGWEGGHYLSMSLSSIVGSKGMAQLFSGEMSWNSPEVVQALDVWDDLHEAGHTTASPTSVDYDTAIAQFYSGDAAMLPTGSWLVGEIDDNAEFEVGYIPFPAPDGPGIFSGGLGSGPYVSSTTEKRDAAIEFLDFLASDEHATWTIENLHTIPPVPLDTENLDVSPLLAQVLEDVAQFGQGGDFGYNIDVMVDAKLNEAMYNGVQAIFTGQATPEEVAATLEAASGS